MIPASYLFKSLYQWQFEREDRAIEAPAPKAQRRASSPRGSQHPAVPFAAMLGLFGLGR